MILLDLLELDEKFFGRFMLIDRKILIVDKDK